MLGRRHYDIVSRVARGGMHHRRARYIEACPAHPRGLPSRRSGTIWLCIGAFKSEKHRKIRVNLARYLVISVVICAERSPNQPPPGGFSFSCVDLRAFRGGLLPLPRCHCLELALAGR